MATKPMQVQATQGHCKLPLLANHKETGCTLLRSLSAAGSELAKDGERSRSMSPTKSRSVSPSKTPCTRSPSRSDSSPSPDVGAPPPDASPSRGGGSGYGGSRTPADDFAEGKRKSRWCRDDRDNLQAMPPRIYVDNKTLIRQVQDFKHLKRGDHCVTAINFVRASTPFADFVVSWLGSIELCYLYHHFIVVDDVHHVDDFGVPRTSDGSMAMIVEWGNSVEEAFAEVTTTAGGKLHTLPLAALQFLLTDKAKFTKHPLADYGDTPHIYLVLEKKSAKERERAALQALDMFNQEKIPYNIVFNNCEHAANKIVNGSHSSAQISFLCWVSCRLVMGLIGLTVLKADRDWNLFEKPCAGAECPRHSTQAMAVYHFFASLPIALHAIVSYFMLMHSVMKQYQQNLIDRHEFYHLIGKELGRTVVVGGWALCAVALAPQIVAQFLARLAVCTFAFMISDMVYNCCAHAVMRLVLIPRFGRVWLIGPAERLQRTVSRTMSRTLSSTLSRSLSSMAIAKDKLS